MMRLVIFSARGLIWQKNELLLLKRSSNSGYCSGYWEFPGGKAEAWNFKKGAEREVAEETGFKALAKKWVGQIARIFILKANNFGLPVLHFTFFFDCLLAGNSEQIKISHEHDSWGWFKPADMGVLKITPVTVSFLESKYFKKYLKENLEK